MRFLNKISPPMLILVYVGLLAVTSVALISLRAPFEFIMLMFVPVLFAAVLYTKRYYLVMLVFLGITSLIILLYWGIFLHALPALVVGVFLSAAVAEVTHLFITDRERLAEAVRDRETVNRAIIEYSPLGISVRGRTGRLLSYNEAWQRIWAVSEEAVQEDMSRDRKKLTFDQSDDYLGEAISEVERVYSQGGQVFLPELETNHARPGAATWVSQYFYAIQNPGGGVNRVVILTEDISERKQIEQCEKDNRALAEALRDTAAALNSTLKLEEVLERILTNVGRVVPHDAVNIMLVKGGIASIDRCQGYVMPGQEEALMSLRLPLEEMPFLRRMAEIGAPVFVPDTSVEPDWAPIPQTAWIRSFAGAPILIKGEPVGFLNLDSAQVGFYNAAHAERLRAFADQAAIAIENARLYEEVQRLAIMDELTGVYNFRGLFELGQREVERSRRYNYSLSALFFDIDHFRMFNKQYTHSVGNLVLRAVAECSKARVRAVDLVARYGGEEFAILLAETDLATAQVVADRLRQDIENMKITTEFGNVNVTVSIGVAELNGEVKDLAMLLDRADQAEHEAKEHGRNRIDVWVKP